MSHRAGIPASWAVTRIGDVVEEGVEQRPPGPKSAHYVDIGSIDRGTKRIGETQSVNASTAPTRARQWIKEGDVLVSMTRPNLNAVAIVPAELNGAVASTGFDVLRAVGMEPGWLFARVRSTEFISDICEDLQGVVYPAIRPRDIRDHRLPAAPLPEQRRVLDALDSYLSRLDETTTLLDRVQRDLKRYRASVLKTAVEGRLVPTEAELARAEKRNYEPASVLLKRILAERRRRWEAEGKRGKYEEPGAPDTSDLPELPKGWCWATVQTIAADSANPICAGPFGTIFKARDFRTEGVPIIFLRHVKPDRYLTAKPNFMLRERWETVFRDYSVWGGELLVTKLGDPPGDCAVFPTERGPAMLTPDVMKLEVNLELAEPRFVMHYINSETARHFVFGAAFGTTRLRLTLPLFRSMPVPLPPLAEQRRIRAEVDRLLSTTEAQEQAVSVSTRRCARLRQAIFTWAFEGKLVDQDPNDEPASALLARIKGEKRTAPSKTATAPRRTANRKS